MKRKQLLTLLLLCFFLCIYSSCGEISAEDRSPYSTSKSQVNEESPVERGRYLVALMDCNSCHTPKKMTEQGPVPDPARLLSGHPASQEFKGFAGGEQAQGDWLLFNPDLTMAIGPWGVSYSANLTPDPTGLGNWTYEQFKRAITKGKHKGMEGGRTLLPPMPWQSYSELKEEDIRAIYDYLQTVEPIENIVPAQLGLWIYRNIKYLSFKMTGPSGPVFIFRLLPSIVSFPDKV